MTQQKRGELYRAATREGSVQAANIGQFAGGHERVTQLESKWTFSRETVSELAGLWGVKGKDVRTVLERVTTLKLDDNESIIAIWLRLNSRQRPAG